MFRELLLQQTMFVRFAVSSIRTLVTPTVRSSTCHSLWVGLTNKIPGIHKQRLILHPLNLIMRNESMERNGKVIVGVNIFHGQQEPNTISPTITAKELTWIPICPIAQYGDTNQSSWSVNFPGAVPCRGASSFTSHWVDCTTNQSVKYYTPTFRNIV